MRYRSLLLSVALAALAVGTSAPIAGQASQARSAAAPTQPDASPRTPWGDPDLQGTWRSVVRLPLQRSKELGTKEFWTEAERAALEAKMTREEQAKIDRRVGKLVVLLGERGLEVLSEIGVPGTVRIQLSRRTSAIVDPPNGRLPPWTPEAIKRWEAREAARRGRGETDSFEDRAWEERCVHLVHAAMQPGLMLPAPPPVKPGYEFDQVATQKGLSLGPLKRELIQMPGYVVLITGEVYQIIPLDGRPPVGPKVRQFRGDQRGRWEGNTLVVDTTHVNDQQNGGAFIPARRTPMHPGSGETLRVTERYTRLNSTMLEYRYTVDDPETYMQPWTAVHELTWEDPPEMVDLPGWCHENNRGLSHFLAAGRAEHELSVQYAEEAARDRLRRLEELKAEWAGMTKSR